jgi:hypothetical protein
MEVPIASLARRKLDQLQSSTIIPKMYLYIEKYDMDPSANCVVYDIEIGIQKGQTVHVTQVRRRYSVLELFDQQIRPLFHDSRFLQPFPPKKLFGNTNPEFLKDRSEKLQKYLTNLVRVAGVTSMPAFIRCFEIDTDFLRDA